MMNLNMRKPLLNMTLHPRPDYGFAVAASLKGAPPTSCDLEAEARQSLRIVRNSVITVVPTNNGSQPLPLVRDWMMHPFSHLRFELTASHEIVFVSSNRWDVAGAAAFGFTPIWCNRTGQPEEYPGLEPVAVVGDLSGIGGLLPASQ